MEADLSLIGRKWPDLWLNEEKARWAIVLRPYIRVSISPYLFIEYFTNGAEKLQLEETRWDVSISNGKYTVVHKINMGKFYFPTYWADHEPRPTGYFYSTEDLYAIADLIYDIWFDVFLPTQHKYGKIVGSYLCGFSVIR